MATERRDEPQTDFMYCSGAATEVLKFGSCQLRSGHKVLFLIIPGNPGVVGFYKTFMQTLHMMFGYQYPVWAASHAGHCVPPTSMDMVDAEEDDVFGLNGQIEHKLAFLRTHVPRETSLVLVGHSIGCYIILEMMKRNPELKVLKAVMLFPTIERMAQTPQGKVMTPVLCYMRYVAYLPLFLVSLLPDTIKAGLIKLVLEDGTFSPLSRGHSSEKIQFFQSLGIIFYYGATDHWCPIQYYHDIKRDFPHGDFRLCENGFRHAFVLDAGRDVAKMVVEWIRGDLTT
uniref:Lipid droplet-associated hydrolase n=1 Tax=Acanthochromis polyacanthus TaxID=80966 RepID=A0A3Q1FS05_9TELE